MASFLFAVITWTEATQARRRALWLTDQGKLIAVGTSRPQEREAAGSGASTKGKSKERSLVLFAGPLISRTAPTTMKMRLPMSVNGMKTIYIYA